MFTKTFELKPPEHIKLPEFDEFVCNLSTIWFYYQVNSWYVTAVDEFETLIIYLENIYKLKLYNFGQLHNISSFSIDMSKVLL